MTKVQLMMSICLMAMPVSIVPAIAADAARPDEPKVIRLDAAHRASAERLIAGGVKFLLAAEDKDGGWSLGGANRPAMTAMVVKVLLEHSDYGIKSPVVKRGLAVLLAYRQKDGGIYAPKEGLHNYHNSIALMALSVAAKHDPRYKPARDAAVKYSRRLVIRTGQKTPGGETIDKDHGFVGGVSYGRHERPDLSNAGMWMEAMHAAGIKPDDPDMREVMSFVLRMHNDSETNKRAVVVAGPSDGGFFYALTESKGGPGPGGKGLRSYGSMTYVGFKSMLYAGLDKSDPRVRAAFTWIRRYWRLDSNPNLPATRSQQGLYYYYHVFAKALKAWRHPIIKDVKGLEHNWRHELIDALAERVGEDGSWVNSAAERWEEGNPLLATCFALLALQETL